MYTADIISGTNNVATIAAEWTALCNEGPCADPFLRPEWFSALALTFGLDLFLITVRRDGSLRAVLPMLLGRSQVHGLPVSSLMSAYDLNSPRFNAIYGEEGKDGSEIFRCLWHAASDAAPWHVLETRLTPRNGPLSDLAAFARDDRHATGIWPMDSAPFISLKDANAETFFSNGRKHFGRELDRRLRRLSEKGEVRFSTHTEYSHSVVQRYLDLETRGWKARAGTAAVQDSRAADLHHAFAQKMAEDGRFLAYELSIDGRIIAMSLNLIDGRRLFHWKTTYDEAYSTYSPGNLLFRRLLNDSIDTGLSEIDLMSPATPNKRVWATDEREHAAFYIFRPGIAGTLLWAWKFLIINRLRRFKRK